MAKAFELFPTRWTFLNVKLQTQAQSKGLTSSFDSLGRESSDGWHLVSP